MSMSRVDWPDLPAEVRRVVADRTGAIRAAATSPAGINSAVAATLDTATGRVFVKGIPHQHPQVRTQRREAAINPHVAGVAPQLLWTVDTAGWSLLGYEHVPGRHADYAPGSADLPLVADAVRRLHRIPCPDIPLKRLSDRFAEFAGDRVDPALLIGDDLLHTDWAPDNVLINDRAHVIDWAWPTRGPAWADVAALVVRLIEAGHTAADADSWARREFPTWATAPPVAMRCFAEAKVRLWDQIIAADPAPWKMTMSEAARAWVGYLDRDSSVRSVRRRKPRCSSGSRRRSGGALIDCAAGQSELAHQHDRDEHENDDEDRDISATSRPRPCGFRPTTRRPVLILGTAHPPIAATSSIAPEAQASSVPIASARRGLRASVTPATSHGTLAASVTTAVSTATWLLTIRICRPAARTPPSVGVGGGASSPR